MIAEKENLPNYVHCLGGIWLLALNLITSLKNPHGSNEGRKDK